MSEVTIERAESNLLFYSSVHLGEDLASSKSGTDTETLKLRTAIASISTGRQTLATHFKQSGEIANALRTLKGHHDGLIFDRILNDQEKRTHSFMIDSEFLKDAALTIDLRRGIYRINGIPERKSKGIDFNWG